MSEKAESDEYIRNSKAYLAWILHLLGKDKEAEGLFNQADELERKISGHRVYFFLGVCHADFLISIKRIDEALELTRANLEICQGENWPDDISRCHRCLAVIERIKGKYKDAEIHLQKAIEIAKKVGMPELEIEALLELGRLHLDMEKYDDAIHKANEALKLITHTGFRLYEPEAELILAKAYLSQGNKEKAKTHATQSLTKSKQMHYKLIGNYLPR